jgi:hypothetical protein
MRTALVVTRANRPEQPPEAEPVVVETDADIVRLQLDDGEWIDFDRCELLAAPDRGGVVGSLQQLLAQVRVRSVGG